KTELSPIHLGPLSRFYGQQFHAESADFDLLILSGIEPQRSILEQIFIQKYSSSTRKLIIIRGFDISADQSGKYDNISFVTNPNDNEFANLALSASRIFCRSGYSTVCDLAALKRRAILIPTPKQPEQEYLAVHLNKNFGFPYITQKDLEKNNFQEINYETQWNFDYICNFNNIFNDKF
ncbi:MAG: hypothetical protein HUK15_04810, partial [Bacteroidales bacterium]|nr:hypothetical protein [Bacteroidales bacterium]